MCPGTQTIFKVVTRAHRLNYILWLEDVLAAVALALGEDPTRPVRGIDVCVAHTPNLFSWHPRFEVY